MFELLTWSEIFISTLNDIGRFLLWTPITAIDLTGFGLNKYIGLYLFNEYFYFQDITIASLIFGPFLIICIVIKLWKFIKGIIPGA